MGAGTEAAFVADLRSIEKPVDLAPLAVGDGLRASDRQLLEKAQRLRIAAHVLIGRASGGTCRERQKCQPGYRPLQRDGHHATTSHARRDGVISERWR